MNKVKINTNNKLTFYLDNASIHRSKLFQKYVQQNNLKIFLINV